MSFANDKKTQLAPPPSKPGTRIDSVDGSCIITSYFFEPEPGDSINPYSNPYYTALESIWSVESYNSGDGHADLFDWSLYNDTLDDQADEDNMTSTRWEDICSFGSKQEIPNLLEDA